MHLRIDRTLRDIAERENLLLALVPGMSRNAVLEPAFHELALLESVLLRSGFSFACEAVESREDLLATLRSRRPSLVFCPFPGYGPKGDRREVRECLEREGVPFIGASSPALELCLSKSRLKGEWESRGIDTPSSFRIRRTRTGSMAGFRLIANAKDYPYIVKPNGENENRGIHARSVAFDPGALLSSVEAALAEYDDLLVEHFVGGEDSREYTVAMIGNGDAALMMPAEISLKEERPIRVVTREDRLHNLTIASPVDDAAEKARLGAFARRALAASGARDYARCDLIDEGGRLFALEVNGQPKIPDPWFDACSSAYGLEREHYLAAIVVAALHRYRSAGLYRRELPSGLRKSLPVAVFERLTS